LFFAGVAKNSWKGIDKHRMRARINLATKALETHRRFLTASGAIAIVAGIVFLALGWHVYSARKSEAELRAKAEEIRRQSAKLEQERDALQRYFALPENAKVHDRAVFINGIIDSRSFNWTQMFMDLERVLPGGVHLLSIEPKQVKGRIEVKLRVGATSEEAKIKFLRALEASREFTRIALDSDGPPTGTSGDVSTLNLTAIYSRT
jgi:type IV pilus assembly protein PilN